MSSFGLTLVTPSSLPLLKTDTLRKASLEIIQARRECPPSWKQNSHFSSSFDFYLTGT